GGIDALGDRLAARRAADGADATADQGAEGAEEAADCRTGEGAGGTARGNADGVGAGCSGDRIGVLVVLVHQVAPGWGGGSREHVWRRGDGPWRRRRGGLNDPVMAG